MNYRNDDGSIKYHSLSINADYENIQTEDENVYSNIPIETEINTQNRVNQKSTGNRDSGHSSESENMTQLSPNQYNDYKKVTINSGSAKEEDRCLENMQSRSRMPISIGSNLNLTVMNDKASSLMQKNVSLYLPIKLIK